jgi:hypothetical protein
MNDTTPRACCPNSLAPGAGGGAHAGRSPQVRLSGLMRRAEAVVEASDGDGRRRAAEQGRRRALGRGLWMEIALEVERSWAFADDDDETTEQSAHS